MMLSEVLRKWRAMRELTLRDASKAIGISAPTLMRLEHGRQPDGKTLSKVMRWLLSDPRRN
jgi:transcriptional regulator with XRE-family HTH domain